MTKVQELTEQIAVLLAEKRQAERDLDEKTRELVGLRQAVERETLAYDRILQAQRDQRTVTEQLKAEADLQAQRKAELISSIHAITQDLEHARLAFVEQLSFLVQQ
jgi:hypothetical protein